MKTCTKDMITAFGRMNTGLTDAARYDLACWLRDNRSYVRAIRQTH